MNAQQSLSCISRHVTPDPLQIVSSALKDLGIHPKVYLQNDSLQVLVESSDVTDETRMPLSIQQALKALGITSVRTVRIYGRAQDKFMPAWVQEFNLGSEIPEMPVFSQKFTGDRPTHQAVICLP